VAEPISRADVEHVAKLARLALTDAEIQDLTAELAGILGHNLCLDIFGGPSAEELAAGGSTHGEGSVVRYRLVADGTGLTASATFPLANLAFLRRIELRDTSVLISETVTNESAIDRPIGWTQHATFGAPFVKNGVSEHRCSATRAKVFEGSFGPADYLAPGEVFDWPLAPRINGGVVDLRRFSSAPASPPMCSEYSESCSS